jgi:RNA polymerase sigma-70 factor (ECF subfamily)
MEKKEEKFKNIISEYQDTIYRLCYSYVDDKEMRQDLYQNILIRIWKGLDSFEERSSVCTWVYRIAVNTSIDFLRTEYNKNSASKHTKIDDIEVMDNSHNPEQNLIIAEKIKFIYHCINKMNFIDKTIIFLYLEDLSYREMAEVIGIGEKNVSVKLYRLKNKLMECVKDF